VTRQGQIVLTNRDREIQHELPSKIPLNLFETKQGAVNCRPNQWKRNSRQCKQIEIKDKSVPKMSRESDGPAICRLPRKQAFSSTSQDSKCLSWFVLGQTRFILVCARTNKSFLEKTKKKGSMRTEKNNFRNETWCANTPWALASSVLKILIHCLQELRTRHELLQAVY
jgi:hypothetical protein